MNRRPHWSGWLDFTPRDATVATLALVASVGCGTALGEDPELTARIDRAEQVVAAQCASASDCECSVTLAQAGCDATLNDEWRARMQAGDSRDLTYDPECLDTIEAAIEDALCGWPPSDDRHPCHDFCQVFHGARSEGESCTRFDDLVSNCDQGLVCSSGRCVAACEALSGLGEGELCRDPITFTDLDRCAQGLTCLNETSRCAQAPAAGSPCLGGECDADSYCDYYSAETLCRPRVGEGASCEQAECQSGFSCAYVETENDYYASCQRRAQIGESCDNVGCDENLDCGFDGRCHPLGDVGASCEGTSCLEDLVCDYNTYTCAEPPPPGQPCLENECARGSFCDTTLDIATCTLQLELATSCTGHRQCESGYCPAGFCDARPRLGESCAGSFVCELGASCDGQVCRASATHGPAVCVYEGW